MHLGARSQCASDLQENVGNQVVSKGKYLKYWVRFQGIVGKVNKR